MELKPGYKQTEVGVIPEDWQRSDVSNIASAARNSVVGGPFGSDLVSADYVDFGVPVIRGQNMGERWVSGDFAFVTTEKANSLAANLARPNDIIFTQRGTLGQISLIPENPYERYLISQSQMKVSLNREIADPMFFYYVFSSTEQQELIKQNTIQTGVPHINLGILREIPVQLPPLPEQRAIAAALSDTDALLSGLNTLIAKKRDIKQAVMQQLLTGKQRLPGFSGEWSLKEVKDLVQVPVTDGPHTTPLFEDVGVPFLSVNNIVDNKINFDDLRYISSSDHDLFSKKCKPIKNDILLGKAASVGKVALVETEKEFNIWSPIALLRLAAKHSPKFFYYLLQSNAVMKQITLLTNSSSQGNLGMGDIEKIELSFPSYSEQAAIASVLSDMDAEIDVLQQRREKTQAIKQGMMQELLTGRTRLV